MLSQQEKYLIVSDMLKKHGINYGKLNEEQITEYAELLSIFFKSASNVNQRGAIDTMDLIIENMKKSHPKEV